MPRKGLFIDTNLLLLYVVGRTGRQYITKHRRLGGYSRDDYAILLNILNAEDAVYVTPNILTETSNLLSQHGEPERSLFMAMLRYIIQASQELYVASTDASTNREFLQLGLTDSALLEVVSEDTPLLTVDVELYIAALAKGNEAAINFTTFRRL